MSDPDAGKPIEVHAIVRGRVQGVGFRATTQHHARRIGVDGTVKNLADGTVEVYAQGDRDLVEQLFNSLKSDTGLGQVEGISLDEMPPKKDYQGFHIIF